MTIQILVCDDHQLMQRGIATLLMDEADFTVVGAASSAHECIRLAQELQPDLVLLDVSLQEPTGSRSADGDGPDATAHTRAAQSMADGITVTRRLKALMPNIRVLILTLHEDERIMVEALNAGASGYIVKRAAESELIDAVRAVMRGDIYIHPTMTRALVRNLTAKPTGEEREERKDAAGKAEAGEGPVEALTPREVDVLRLLARGHTNRQIAEKLVLSVRTVEAHRANISAKLGTKSRVDLAEYAESHNLLD